MPEEAEDGDAGSEPGSARLEPTFLVRGERLERLHSSQGWTGVWFPDALGRESLELFSARCRVVNLTSLIRSKASTRRVPLDATKDGADLKLLRTIV